jgi:hypothetical protein
LGGRSIDRDVWRLVREFLRSRGDDRTEERLDPGFLTPEQHTMSRREKDLTNGEMMMSEKRREESKAMETMQMADAGDK